jgi:restriction system protein
MAIVPLAMGYFVAHVAPPGADGGADVTAYKDPLGTVAPRIRVQVKHREQKVSIKEVRELEAVLRKEGDIGLFVSRTGFTADAEREIRSSTKHIETMDLDRLVSLWQQHYEKLSETGKSLLLLVKEVRYQGHTSTVNFRRGVVCPSGRLLRHRTRSALLYWSPFLVGI